jgi:hypothetical protein
LFDGETERSAKQTDTNQCDFLEKHRAEDSGWGIADGRGK